MGSEGFFHTAGIAARKIPRRARQSVAALGSRPFLAFLTISCAETIGTA